jgi:uncharacterized protein YbbC (DUF1343 family)
MVVRTGLEVLLDEQVEKLRGKRVGVIANPASINRELEHVTDLFFAHPDIDLRVVMGPQHGVFSDTQDNMIEWEGFRDPFTELPVFSLYGETRKPTEEMMSYLDVLVCDLQDVGARYYTYVYTMALAMEACQELDKEFVVLDRPNPINGTDIEGTVLSPEFSSFVGMYPLAIRHGMTIGELAVYFNLEQGIDCRLTIIPMQGWCRDSYADETGQPWVPPSPNLPTLDSAIVYPGLCLLEGTNVSEGRGTTRPFEFSGAPWINPGELVSRLRGYDLPGVDFRPIRFQPTFHKWREELVGGVQIYVQERKSFRPFLTGLALIREYMQLGKDLFEWKPPPYEYEFQLLPFDILCGTDRIRELLEAGASLDAIAESWSDRLSSFAEKRMDYLQYE